MDLGGEYLGLKLKCPVIASASPLTAMLDGLRWLLALALVLAAGAAVHAQGYPAKPVRIVIPFAPGGGSDAMARPLTEKLHESTGQPFVLEYKPGATGIIGADYVAKSAPDAYTLLIVPSNIATNQLIHPKMPFDVVRDFAPIILLGSSPGMLGGRPSLAVATVAELIAYARANPGKLTYASCGSGSPQHIAGELLKAMAGVNIVHVPYKGCPQGIPDVIGGQVDLTFNTLANLAPHVKSGRIRGYAVTTVKRSSFAPEVPSVAESGLPGFDADVWFGLFAPAGSPRDAIARLNAEANRILALREVRDRMAAQLYEPAGGTPEDLAETIRRDMVRYGKVVREANIRPD